LNEKNVQQVLEIEKQAQAVYETAVNEAKEIPLQAEQEAQMIVEKARAEAEAQAHQMIESAQSERETARIMAEAEEKVHRAEAVAKSNFKRAVADVLCRVVGKE
jgi:vacuolar-type H+-ATPase subunit H